MTEVLPVLQCIKARQCLEKRQEKTPKCVKIMCCSKIWPLLASGRLFEKIVSRKLKKKTPLRNLLVIYSWNTDYEILITRIHAALCSIVQPLRPDLNNQIYPRSTAISLKAFWQLKYHQC